MGKLVRIQQGNQVYTMTLPAEIAKALGVGKGDYVMVDYDATRSVATIRKVGTEEAPKEAETEAPKDG
jgi:bifunctional DNA-binding transcriptional regulator/antitoxin component of YhaV-PrlF toxin-antitoxin module